jgi:outer membrane protein assembly factor BamB
MKRSTFLLTLLILTSFNNLRAADWPRWQGPDGNNVLTEKGLLSIIPEAGLKLLWESPVGNAYSGLAVAGGKVFAPDYQVSSGTVDASYDKRTTIQGQESLKCFDSTKGTLIWEVKYDCPVSISFPNGPRATPFVDGNVVYSLGCMGDVLAVSVDTGKILWQKNLPKEYNVEAPFWGYASHPLVVGELLYLMPGGQGTTAVALDKKTGKEVWRALSAREPGYAPPVMISHGGKQHLIAWHSQAINSLEPLTGKVFWTVPFDAMYGMSIMAPVFSGDSIFIGAAAKKSMLLKLKADQGVPDIVWEGSPKMALAPKNGTTIVSGEFVYGCDDDGDFSFARLSTGERLWKSDAPMKHKKVNSGTLFLVKVEGVRHFLVTDSGDFVIADIDEKGYQETSRWNAIEPTTLGMGRKVMWNHPAFANRALFVRNDKVLRCYSLAE